MISQEENYIEIRDSLRNSRKKKDGKTFESSQSSKQLSSSTSTMNSSMNANKKNSMTSSTSMSMSSKNPSSKVDLNTSGEIRVADIQALHLHQLQQDENSNVLMRNSSGSDGTEYTSVTEVRERASSATVIRSSGY